MNPLKLEYQTEENFPLEVRIRVTSAVKSISYPICRILVRVDKKSERQDHE